MLDDCHRRLNGYDYPAVLNCDNMIVVAASNENDEIAHFSDYGADTVHLAAPGEGILSTVVPTAGYDSYDGTSMATPHVTGAAALLLSHNSALAAQEIKQLILDNVDQCPALSGKVITNGRLNVYKAMSALVNSGVPSVPASVNVTIAPNTLTVPQLGSDTALASAVVKDASNNTLFGQTVTWSLSASYTGVSINSSTGVVTVTSSAAPGMVTVKATCGSAAGTADLTLGSQNMLIPSYVSVMVAPNELTIPPFRGLDVMAQAIATVYDQNGQVMNGQSVAWSIVGYPNAVEIDSITGVITVDMFADAGPLTIKAVCGGVSGTAELILYDDDIPPTVSVALSLDRVKIPQSSSVTSNAVATLYNQFGEIISMQSVTWMLAAPYTGVSINSSTGVVTVNDNAPPGIVSVKVQVADYNDTYYGTATISLH